RRAMAARGLSGLGTDLIGDGASDLLGKLTIDHDGAERIENQLPVE
ncbi:hypothetical protein I4699_22170, partial [Xanthomonas hortorum pv. carotae]|nr:hypothetical protein [Xanthomonas hortorum pv. carotae]